VPGTAKVCAASPDGSELAGVFAVRPGRAEDAGEIVRLAEAMFRSLGIDPGPEVWEHFRQSARASVRGRSGDDACFFVADHPDEPGRLVACGAGVIVRRLPTPGQVDGRNGYVQWMSTDPAFRRRGLGRGVLRSLLGWFEAQGVGNVELHASPDGEPLYRSEGFWRGPGGEPLRRLASEEPGPADEG
jgi:GNAT superfamily N-acetyltransferase